MNQNLDRFSQSMGIGDDAPREREEREYNAEESTEFREWLLDCERDPKLAENMEKKP